MPQPPILVRLYPDEHVTVGPTTGTEMITNARLLFTGYLDPYFKYWGTNVPSAPTSPREVAIYEVHEDADFQTMFGTLSAPEVLCLEQGEILDFVRKYRSKLHPEGWATFFLFKVKGEVLVTSVRVYDYGTKLTVHIKRFNDVHVYPGLYRYRVVVLLAGVVNP